MMDYLTLLIVILGTSTVVLSIFVAVKFKQQAKHLKNGSRRLSKALMWQLIGEALLGAGTLAFAMLAYLNMLPTVPVAVQSAMRLFIFSASGLTTIHLYLTTTRLNK